MVAVAVVVAAVVAAATAGAVEVEAIVVVVVAIAPRAADIAAADIARMEDPAATMTVVDIAVEAALDTTTVETVVGTAHAKVAIVTHRAVVGDTTASEKGAMVRRVT
jgi:hypothetical protein